MKIFKTIEDINDIHNVIFFEKTDKKTTVVQIAVDGFYAETFDFEIKNSFSLNKKDFHKIMEVLKNDFEIKENKDHILFIKGKTKIKSQKTHFKFEESTTVKIEDIILKEEEYQELSANFLTRVKTATKFATSYGSNTHNAGIFIVGQILSATDSYKSYLGGIDVDLGAELYLLPYTFKTFSSPKAICVKSDRIHLADHDKGKYARLKVVDRKPIDIAGFCKRIQPKTVSVAFEFDKLKDALINMTKLGFENVRLSTNKLEAVDLSYKVPNGMGYTAELELDIANDIYFNIGNLLTFVAEGKLAVYYTPAGAGILLLASDKTKEIRIAMPLQLPG